MEIAIDESESPEARLRLVDTAHGEQRGLNPRAA